MGGCCQCCEHLLCRRRPVPIVHAESCSLPAHRLAIALASQKIAQLPATSCQSRLAGPRMHEWQISAATGVSS